jgi:CBS domain containing-hemolysin-like protein
VQGEGRDPDERRLARTVGAEHHPAFCGEHHPVDPVEDRPAVPAQTDVDQAQGGVHGGQDWHAGSSVEEGDVPIDIALGLLAFAVLVLATSFFVAAEFALVAVDRDRVDSLAERGDRRARGALAILRRLSFNLSGAQLGITVTSLIIGFIAEPTMSQILDPLLGVVPEGARDTVSVTVALLLATSITMVLGELVPKGVAVAKPLETALVLSRPIRVYGVVFGFLIRMLNAAADWLVRRLGVEPREELQSIRTIEELELLIMSSGEEGTLDPEAFQLLARTMRFSHKTAADALVPRVDMVAVPADATVGTLEDLAVRTGHSRFPVVGDGSDDIVGVVSAKNVLRVPSRERTSTPVIQLVEPATFVPEGRDLESLLTELRKEAVQLAVVVDEYGGVAGIVTLEDLLEEIVGEIEDEHDPEPSLTTPLPEGTVVVDGSLHIDEVDDVTGIELPEGPYETIAGFLLDRLGHIPMAGERVLHDGWLLEVLAMDRRRIAAVRVSRPKRTQAQS